MILHSIMVENWRNFLGEHFVGPFDEGINILHAPNATGKSTLFEALQRGLVENHSTTGEDVRKLCPWGRNLSPGVTIEFTVDGVRYRAAKNFLNSPKSLLERYEEGSYMPLSEGPVADEEIRKLITAEGSKRGFSKPNQWGMRQILWAPQGGLETGKLSGNLLDDIRKTVAEQAKDDRARIVEVRLKERYGKYFTDKGQVKAASDLKKLGKEIEEVAASLANAKIQLEEAELLSEEIMALSVSFETLKEEVRSFEEENSTLQKKAETFLKLQGKYEKQTSAAKVAGADFRRQQELSDQIDEGEEEKKKLEEAIKKLQADLPGIEADRDKLQKDLAMAEQESELARAGVQKAEKQIAQSREAARAGGLKEQAASLAGRIGVVAAAEKVLSALEEKKGLGRFPAQEEIRKIREVFSRLERAKIQLDASKVALEIIPVAPFAGTIQTEDGTESITLEAGKALKLEGAPEVRASIEAFGTIRAFSPLESAREASEAVNGAKKDLSKLTAPFETIDKDQLEELYEKGLSLDRQIEKERAGLNALLGGESVDTLVRKAEDIEEELHAIFERSPAWRTVLPDPAELEAAAAEEKQAADKTVLDAENARNSAAKALSAKDGEFKVAEERLRGRLSALMALEERLKKLKEDGLTKKERAEALVKCALALNEAKTLAEEYRKQLEELGADPTRELENALRNLKDKRNDLKDLETNLIIGKAKVETKFGQGLYTAVSNLEEKLFRLEEERRREKLDADSTRLLWEAFSDCRSEMTEAVNSVASGRATEIFTRIAGKKGGKVVLDKVMIPSGFVPGGMDGDVGIEPLSGGEKEQLHFAVRMALAECCSSKEERELLVLDDILMATDGIRFPRILEIIEEASESLQILILTCQPERFASIEKANRIDLQALTEREG